MATNISVLDVLYVVMLKISFWSGMKRISAEDLGGVDLPPADLASLGSKKLVSPDVLKVFGTIRSRVTTYLDRNAVRFCGGWSFHEDYVQNVAAHLEQCRSDFEDARDSFLSQYDVALEEWKSAHQEWARMLERSPLSPEEVGKKFSFGYQMFRISPPNDEDASQGLASEVENLGSTLFSEIAAEARAVWKRVFEGRIICTHKALSPVRSIREKLYANSYVEPGLSAPLVRLIDRTLAFVNQKGSIEGVQLAALQGLVSMLSDPARMLEHARLVLEGRKTEEAVVGDLASAGMQFSEYTSEDIGDGNVGVCENIDANSVYQASNMHHYSNVIESCGLW